MSNTIEQQIITNAYAIWMSGQVDNWYRVSPYICGAIQSAAAEMRDNGINVGTAADDICMFIGMKCLRGHHSVQEFLGLYDYYGSYDHRTDPQVIAFRHGLWDGLAKKYGVTLTNGGQQ